MGKLFGSVVVSRLLNVFRSVIVLSLLSESAIVYYEYFKQFISSNKFSDTGFASVIERDANDKSINIADISSWGIILEVFSFVLISFIVFQLSMFSNWPYHKYIFFIILLIALAKLKRIAEAFIIIRTDKRAFQRQLIFSSTAALLLFVFFYRYDLILSIFISNFVFLLTPIIVALGLPLASEKQFFYRQNLSVKSLFLVIKYCSPIFILSLCYLFLVVSDRVYVKNIPGSFAVSFAALMLLVNFLNLLFTTFLRFERQRLNLTEVVDRKKSYINFITSGFRVSFAASFTVALLFVVLGLVWPLFQLSIPFVDSLLHVHIGIILILLFTISFSNWIYIVVSKSNEALWIYSLVIFGTSCFLQLSQYFITPSPWLFVLIKCLPFLILLGVFRRYISSNFVQ